MMGREAPETCWATHKCQVINLWNCCILLDDLFESYDDARTCERQTSHTCLLILLFFLILWSTLSPWVLIVTRETVCHTWYSGMFIICFPNIFYMTNFGYCHQIYSDTFCISHVPCISQMYKIFKKTSNLVCSVLCWIAQLLCNTVHAIHLVEFHN